jgi:Kef-type K+ transport system membrane component KefB
MFMWLKRGALCALFIAVGIAGVINLYVSGSVSAYAVPAENNQVVMAEPAPIPIVEPSPEEDANNASEKSEENHSGAIHFGVVFAMFALVLIVGKIGNFVERYGQPAVIGELLAGIALSALGYFGWDFISQTSSNEIIAFIASFGALLLLFSIGLESNLLEMKRVGLNAMIVALIGVTVPFVLGTYILAPIFYADASSNAKLFLGASLVATSVGITASVFRALKMIRTRAAQTVLGAAVIDDVLGLIVLAVVSALATGGTVTALSVAFIALKSFGFLVGALLLGSLFAKHISTLFSKLYNGIGMKLTVAIGFALVFGYLAELFGLEPIIGAFAAGLLLDHVHFNSFADPEIVSDLKALDFKAQKDRDIVLRLINKHKQTHVEDLISTISLIFVPVFFVYTGMQIDFGSLLQPRLYAIAAVISIFAIIGKVVAGLAAKGSRREKLLVGVSMVPRGEVGLIFAATGKATGVLGDELFSVIVLVVIITTFIAPPLIKLLAEPSTES